MALAAMKVVEVGLNNRAEAHVARMASFRLDEAFIDALDQAAKKLSEMNNSNFGPKWSKTDVMRYFVRKGLAELGIHEKPTTPARRGRRPK